MRNSREKWVFFKHASKGNLSGEEVRYWRKTLSNLLKVGIEFEMNLPDVTGNCKGNNNSCPCMHLNVKDCWKECTNMKSCSSKPNKYSCGNRDADCDNGRSCVAEGVSCENYMFKCIGMNCSQFMAKCAICNELTLDCAKCAHRYDPDLNPINIRNRIRKELKPSNNYGKICDSGVHSITTDGSLLGGEGKDKGIEVITIGRRIDYNEFFKMSDKIISLAESQGAYVNERCSIHMHLLTSHYGSLEEEPDMGMSTAINELERPIPELILANFHQLCRRYQNAMTWMCMGLDDPDKMTRWEKYRVSILDISPTLCNMETVRERVANAAGGTKYGWVNYKYTTFDTADDVDKLHVEMRVLDGMMSPSVVAAVACMFYAIIIKAVEISRYGLLRIGDEDWLLENKKVKQALLNNYPKDWNADHRFSNTSKLYKYYDFLTAESLELLQQLKHILMRIGPSYSILEQLAAKPVALRRCDGESWKDIENSFAVRMSDEDIVEAYVDEFIDLRIISDCKTFDEWLSEIEIALQEKIKQPGGVTMKQIANYVDNMRLEGHCIWSNSLGTIVRV